jgi:hypothetical protein
MYKICILFYGKKDVFFGKKTRYIRGLKKNSKYKKFKISLKKFWTAKKFVISQIKFLII